MGLFGDILGPIFGSDDATTTASSTASAMGRPSEYSDIFAEFMSKYLNPDRDKILYDEKRIADQEYLDKLAGIKDPYLGAVKSATGTHGGLLNEIINKRMAGEAVGPYAADIDKLLGERTGVGFGGAEPMQFITGNQQKLLSDLLAAQETGLGNIQGTSQERLATDIAPATKKYGMDKALADLGLSQFMPSNIADISYLKDLRSMIEPMEYARYSATPSVTSTSTAPGSPLGFLGELGGIFSDVGGPAAKIMTAMK